MSKLLPCCLPNLTALIYVEFVFIVLLTLSITQHEYSTHVDPTYICQHHMRHVNVVLAVVVDALKAKLFCEDILRNE